MAKADRGMIENCATVPTTTTRKSLMMFRKSVGLSTMPTPNMVTANSRSMEPRSGRKRAGNRKAAAPAAMTQTRNRRL